jgi:hypothetical protein
VAVLGLIEVELRDSDEVMFPVDAKVELVGDVA